MEWEERISNEFLPGGKIEKTFVEDPSSFIGIGNNKEWVFHCKSFELQQLVISLCKHELNKQRKETIGVVCQ